MIICYDDYNDYNDTYNRYLDSKGVSLLSTTIPNIIKKYLHDDSSRGVSFEDIKFRNAVPFQDIFTSSVPSQETTTASTDMAQEEQRHHTYKFDFQAGRKGFKTIFPWVDQGK